MGKLTYRMVMKKQADYFGLETRMNQAKEEMAELTKELCKAQRIIEGDITCDEDIIIIKQKITEEIADVELVLEELKYLLNNKNRVRQAKKYKIRRTDIKLREKGINLCH